MQGIPDRVRVQCRLIAEHARLVTGSPRAHLLLYDETRRRLVTVATTAADVPLHQVAVDLIRRNHPGLDPLDQSYRPTVNRSVHDAFVGQRTQVTTIAEAFENILPPSAVALTHGLVGITHVVTSPVIAEGRALGLVRFLVPASPSDAQLALMDAAADQIGLTLANAELAEQTRRQLAATQAMGEVARLAASTGVQTTLEALVARIRELTEADGAIVYLADARGETYSAAAQSLADPSFTADLGRLESPTRRIGHGLIGWVIAAGEAAFVPDVRRDPRLASGRTATRPPEASIIVPMRVQGRTLGCLRLSRISKRRFTESDLWLAQMLADQAALAVQSAQEQERTRVGAPAEAALATVAGAMHEIAIPVEELLRVAKAEDSVDPGELRTQLAAARSAAERIQTAMHVLQVTVDRAVDGTRDKSAALVQAGAGGEPGHDRVDAG